MLDGIHASSIRLRRRVLAVWLRFCTINRGDPNIDLASYGVPQKDILNSGNPVFLSEGFSFRGLVVHA